MLLSSFAASADRFYVESTDLEPGTTETLQFILENSQDIYGFQADVILPEGLEPVLTDAGEPEIYLTSRAENGNYELSGNVLSNGRLRMGAFSTTHTPFSGVNGALVEMKVNVLTSFAGGYMNVSNIKLIDSSDQDLTLEDSDAFLNPIIFVTSIVLNTSVLSLTEGETATLTATALPEEATDKTLTWSSSDESVAVVSSDGVVTAMSVGSATLTATAINGVSASCNVTVEAKMIEVSDITLSNTELNLTEGETATLTATIQPADATDKTVTWTSSDAAVATVSASGVVTAVKSGTATITATSANGKTATCSVTVDANIISVESIAISKTELSLTEGDTATLTATVTPDNATDKTVTWSSSDSDIATVDQEGNVTALYEGKATITASSSNGKAAVCEVTVLPVTSFDDGTLRYNVIASNTVEVAGPVDIHLTSVIIPSEATYHSAPAQKPGIGTPSFIARAKERVYVVTAIGDAAFKNCTEIESVEISETITSIGESAFSGCTGLTEIVIPENVENIGSEAFSGCDNLTSIEIQAETPPEIGENPFPDNAVITVPSKETYEESWEGIVDNKIEDVEDPAVTAESLTITPDVWTGEEGSTFTITATVLPENATDKTLLWESSDVNVATVDNEGNVTVINEGTCVITVSTVDGSNLKAECAITSLAGIDQILSDPDARVDVYNLNGVIVKRDCTREDLKQLTPAIYLIRQGGKVVTVFISRNL